MTGLEMYETGISEDERIALLEKNLRAMESRVKVLIDELLDFKAVARTMSLQQQEDGEASPEQVAIGATLPSTASPRQAQAIIRQDAYQQPCVPAVETGPRMVRIMQADGTMKMEPRHGDAGTH